MITVSRKRPLPPGWRFARFSEFLRRVERKVIVDNHTLYACVGVQWYGMGAFVRENVLGENIARKQQWVIRTGDIVYNKLFAWKGAFAIADDSFDGCIVSDKFPAYLADLSVVDLAYLGYYFRTPQLARQAQILSRGAAAVSKLTMNPPKFWELTMPLPPIGEQRRIAARLSEQMAQVDRMRRAARAQVEAAKALPAAFLRRVFESLESARYPKTRVDELCDFLPAKSVRTGGDTRVLTVTTACLSEIGFLPSGLKEAYMDSADALKATLRPGEILIARSNTPDLVGRAAQYSGESSDIVASDLTIRLWPRNSKIRSDFLAAYLSALYVTGYWREKAGGTSGSMKKIRRTQLAAIPVPNPPIAHQEQVVHQLREQMSPTQKIRRTADAELQALNALPGALLEEVFGGFELSR